MEVDCSYSQCFLMFAGCQQDNEVSDPELRDIVFAYQNKGLFQKQDNGWHGPPEAMQSGNDRGGPQAKTTIDSRRDRIPGTTNLLHLSSGTIGAAPRVVGQFEYVPVPTNSLC